MNRKMVAVLVVLALLSQPVLIDARSKDLKEIKLPAPKEIRMSLEKALMRRNSVRVFSEENISLKDLSTILWAAYGYTSKGRTIHCFNCAVKIYVLMKDGVYVYDPERHALVLYKEGDYRNVSQYKAPIQIGIVWNRTKGGENLSCAEIGAIGQNVYLAANALNLGTVTTVGFTLKSIGLPKNEVPKIIMPLGHLKHPYKFIYLPFLISNFPRVKFSNVSLTEALNELERCREFGGNLTEQEKAQIIWSTYGYSYYVDFTKDEFRYHLYRHRTVPSAHAYYPLRIYAITKEGIYRFIPNIYDPIYKIPIAFIPMPIPVFSFIVKVKSGDHREVVSEAIDVNVSSSPLIIISILDLDKTRPKGHDDFSGKEFRWLWYYEAGASAHNALLEAITFNLSASVYPIKSKETILNLLELSEDKFDPLLVTAIGISQRN